MSTIGFAGLGRMGRPMARNLELAGHAVLVHDPALTGERAGSVAELAAAPLSISMLPDGDTTRELVDELVATAGAGHLHVIMGTVGPAVVRDLAAAAHANGVHVIDAPVSGSVGLAESAGITTMVGATEEQFARVRPVLAAMTSAQHHTGPVGSGSAAKLAVNTVLAALNHGIAEGLLLAEAGGLDAATFYDVLLTSAAAAPYVHYKRDTFLCPGSTAVAAPVSLIRKDVHLALRMANENGLSLPGTRTVAGVLDVAVEAGMGERDMAEVLAALRGVRSGGSDAEVIRELEQRRYAAVVEGDFATFAALAHPALAYTHSDGTLDDLASYLDKCISGFYDYHRIEHPVDRIVVAGDTAIVVGEMRAELTAGGIRKKLANRALAVWVRVPDGWRLLAYQPTVLPDTAWS
ncbi:NAD(P)-binding domain-containing protein [Actinomycetes bacterium KLBMP 9759]